MIPGIEDIPILDLRPYPRNARRHSVHQIEKLARAISEVGFLIPVLIDDQNTILAGHARVEAARRLNMRTVPCIRASHLTETQKRKFIIFDNRLAQDASWDFDVLAEELKFLSDENVDLTTTEFEYPEIEMILNSADGPDEGTLEDPLPEPMPGSVVSKVGDLWALGDHRLFCGDARRDGSFVKLMGEEIAQLAFVDPPYNVKIRDNVSGKGKVKHDNFELASGEQTSAQFAKFLEDALNLLAAYSADGAIHYVCSDWRHLDEMLTAGRRIYNELKNLAVWVKTNAGQGSLYRSQHELVLVWKYGRAKHINNIELGKHGRHRSNVWTYAGANSFGRDRLDELAMHPTVKPVALVADAIRDCSRRGDIVLDGFGGSGTTLIACEQTQRKARLIELDPVYCDVIVRRWQNSTGRRAVQALTGRAFDDMIKPRKARG